MERLFESEELTGEVVGVRFRNRDTGYGVVELQLDDGAGAACVGPLSDLVEGQHVRLVGRWVEHPRHGETFDALLYEQVAPTTAEGLRTFLRSDRFEDVSARAIQRVLTVFGAGAGRVIEHEPDRLVAEAGLEREEADALHDRWRAGLALAQLVQLLEPARVPHTVTRAAHAYFGATAAEVLRANPYALLEVERARFAHADALGQHLGVDPLDGLRLAAGARAAMAAARRRDGHQYLTHAQCTQEAASLLKVDVVAAGRGVEIAEGEGALVRERIATPDGVVDALYTPPGLAAERELAEDIARLTVAHSRLRPFADTVEPSDDLTAGQAQAVQLVFDHPVTVLTGGPGTGKTRTIAEVVDAAEAVGLSVAVCAPTGRAAKRIEELVGHPASTVHRLLEARPVAGGAGFAFRYGRGERLPFDLVVCDEVSMADTSLAAHLTAAIEDGAHLLFVGDPDQLPPVGPGDVLRDLLRSGVVPHVTLTEIHRQAAESRIVTLANAINDGQVWDLSGSDGDLFHAESPRRGIVARVVEAVANRAPDFFGVDVEQVQVVSPIYRGEAGVDALNGALKEALNPAAGRPDVGGFHEHDRVMQTRNDPELDVSNGDVGRVVDVDAGKRELRVLFPRGEVTYDTLAVRDLVPAWAVTVHKSQGGEWPVVVFVVESSHRAMLWRNLAYTAVTRAQRALITVGQAAAIQAAARHDVPRNRQTLLAQRLADLAGSAATTTEVSA